MSARRPAAASEGVAGGGGARVQAAIKAIGLLPNVLLRLQAADAGAYEAILIRDGRVTEGAASNVFAVHAGVETTPPKGSELLPGITRDLIVELLQAAHPPCHETPISAEALASADEIWLTSSVRELCPVTTLDGRPVGRGVPGPLWRAALDLYQAYKQRTYRGEVEG